MTTRDRTHEHRSRLAARARRLDDAVPVQHRVHREGADAEDVVPADEQRGPERSEEHTSELQSPCNLVCRLLLEKKKKIKRTMNRLPRGRVVGANMGNE